ncbi:MAG TPA: hypothetical protein VKB10_05040 [Gaiellaceae bacterium]|nr:hypothetical protein [Gaiellaceae bacterium]
MADLVERYLELGLRLGRHADGLVDSYYGPLALAQRVAAEELRAPAALAEDAELLLEDLPADPWLAGQVRSLATTARKLAGERFGYAKEVELVYGIEPRWHDESRFGERRSSSTRRSRATVTFAPASRAGSSRRRSRRTSSDTLRVTRPKRCGG